MSPKDAGCGDVGDVVWDGVWLDYDQLPGSSNAAILGTTLVHEVQLDAW